MKEAISIGKRKQKVVVDKHIQALTFKENDWVAQVFKGTPKLYIRQREIRTPLGHQKYYAKLAKRYYGPF